MRPDEDIKRDVEEEVRWNPEIDAADLAVDVRNGIVTLAAYVPSFNQKWEAERAVKRVASVVAAVNNIEVRLPAIGQRPNTEIARAAVAAIQWNLENGLSMPSRAFPLSQGSCCANRPTPGPCLPPVLLDTPGKTRNVVIGP